MAGEEEEEGEGEEAEEDAEMIASARESTMQFAAVMARRTLTSVHFAVPHDTIQVSSNVQVRCNVQVCSSNRCTRIPLVASPSGQIQVVPPSGQILSDQNHWRPQAAKYQ